MDYEQKYKEALERAKALYAKDAPDSLHLESIFPELKESEDEKIRKEIISHVQYLVDYYNDSMPNYGKWLAWLEKQGENTYNKELSELLHKVICRFINDPNIPYTEREKVSMEIIPYVERLEKQGEQKPVPDWMPKFLDELRSKKNYFGWDEHKDFEGGIVAIINWMNPNYFNEKDGKQKVDKVEPKFHEGEWIANGDYTWKIVEVKPLDYILQSQDGNIVDNTISYVDEQFHSFTIKDAKDGDVLKEDSCIFIIEKMNPNGTAIVHCCLFDDGDFDLIGSTLGFDEDSTYPATKEQRDLLFQKMKEAGYEWDAEKKELKKIEQKPADNKGMNIDEESMTPFQKKVFCIIDTAIEEEQGLKQVCDELLALASNEIEQKPAWSEEDESRMNNLCHFLEEYGNQYYGHLTLQGTISWLKSLNPQPKQEWSEEDKNRLKGIIATIKMVGCRVNNNATNCSYIDWLKSLRPQNRWKPSEEQMENLSRAFNGGTYRASLLMELYQDLKKLK